MAQLIFEPLNANGTPGTFRVAVPSADSEMAKDRETRQGHRDAIVAVLSAPMVRRHLDVFPDRFAKERAKPEVRLTREQFAEGIVGPVTAYAREHPDATPAQCLAYVLSRPVTVTGGRRAGGQSGDAAFATLAGMLADAISAARETVTAEDASGDTDADTDADDADADGESGDTDADTDADADDADADDADNAPRARRK